MRRIFVVGLISFLCCSAFAEPEIRGTAVELTHFLNGISKTTSVAGEAEVRVPAHRAILSLGIVTENKSLQDALRQNAEMRNKVADFLRKQGIPSDRIQASKFSSTPKFGLFGDKAKSYRVENVMRVAVQDEKEFQAAAGAVDSWQEVRFGGVEFEYADKEALRQKAISEACDNANQRKKIYEEKFGVTLTAATFTEGSVVQMDKNSEGYSKGARSGYASAMPSIAIADESMSSFGELVFTAKVTVEYTVRTK